MCFLRSFLANLSHPRYFTNWNFPFLAEVLSCNLVHLLRNVTGISNDFIVALEMVNISAITKKTMREMLINVTLSGKETDRYNFTEATKGAFVIMKYADFQVFLRALYRIKHLKIP